MQLVSMLFKIGGKYSIFNQKIIECFEIGKFFPLNLLKSLVLLKWLIYVNDYLTYYNNIGGTSNFADMWFYNYLSYDYKIGGKFINNEL